LLKSALVEDKKLTLTVHYRNVKNNLIRGLKKKVFDIVNDYKGKIRITTGKKIIEVKPDVNWNKGKAVLKILRKVNARDNKKNIIYIGDDNTDEDVFRVLDKKAITIHVGNKRKSFAQYYVKNVRGVQKFLEWIDSINN